MRVSIMPAVIVHTICIMHNLCIPHYHNAFNVQTVTVIVTQGTGTLNFNDVSAAKDCHKVVFAKKYPGGFLNSLP